MQGAPLVLPAASGAHAEYSKETRNVHNQNENEQQS